MRFPGFEGEWENRTIAECCTEFQSGKFINADAIADEGAYPVYGGNGLRGYAQSYNHDGDYTLIGRQGALCGNVRFVKGKTYITEHAIAVKASPENDTRFLAFLFDKMNLRQYSDQSAQPGLAVNKLLKLRIDIPRLEEQTKISKFLSCLDERISIQNKVIEKYESLIKALRCHIFSTIESEKEVTIADVLSYEQPTKYIVSDTEYSDNKDLTPVLTANKAFVLGYTEETKGIYDKGPCIILDDFTLDSKIVDFPFKVKSSAIKILSAKTSVHLRYIYEYLKFLDLNTEEHKRHYISEIEPMTIELPDEDAIQSIAYLFDRMDQRRQGLERDLQLLKYQKDYLLRTLFI